MGIPLCLALRVRRDAAARVPAGDHAAAAHPGAERRALPSPRRRARSSSRAASSASAARRSCRRRSRSAWCWCSRACSSALPVVDASGLRDITGVTTTSDKPPAADLRHVRVVPRRVGGVLGLESPRATRRLLPGRHVQRAVGKRQAGVGRAARFPGRGPMARARHEPGRDRRQRGESRRTGGIAPASAAALHPLGAAEHQPHAARLHDVRHGTAARDDAAARRGGRSQVHRDAGPPDDRLERRSRDGGGDRRSGDRRDAAHPARSVRLACRRGSAASIRPTWRSSTTIGSGGTCTAGGTAS